MNQLNFIVICVFVIVAYGCAPSTQWVRDGTTGSIESDKYECMKIVEAEIEAEKQRQLDNAPYDCEKSSHDFFSCGRDITCWKREPSSPESAEAAFSLGFMPGINKDKEIERCLENKGWRKEAIKQAWVQ